MNKIKITSLLVIAILVLSSCTAIKNELGFGDKAGLSYNDLSVSENDLEDDFKQLETNKKFTEQFKQSEQAFLVKGKISPEFKVAWLNIQLQILSVKEARIAGNIKIIKADKSEAEKNAKAFFNNGDAALSEKIWKAFDKSFQDRLIKSLEEQAAFVRSIKSPNEKEKKAYYDKLCPSGVEVSHILVANESDAIAIKKELDAGGDFASIAKEKSSDTTSGENGGSLGCLTDGQFVVEFEEGAKALSAGQISDPVKTKFGYHIITTKIFSSYDEIKDQISEQIKKEKEQAEYKKIEDKVKKAKVKVSKKYGKVEKTDGIPSIVVNETKEEEKTNTIPTQDTTPSTSAETVPAT